MKIHRGNKYRQNVSVCGIETSEKTVNDKTTQENKKVTCPVCKNLISVATKRLA